MSANRLQRCLLQHLRASVRVRRRSVPPSLPVQVSRSVHERWRERPRCPARRVTQARGGGVVHAIGGRAACPYLRTEIVADECAARVPVFASRFRGTTESMDRQKSGASNPRLFTRKLALAESRTARRTIARSMLAPGSASSMLFASLRPGLRPGLRALTTPPRGTSQATARWWPQCR